MKYLKLFENFEEHVHSDEYPWDNIDSFSERQKFVLLLKEFSKPKGSQLNMNWVRELIKDVDINFNNIRTHWNYNFWKDWTGIFDRDFFNTGTNLLITACKMGHLEAVKELLKNPDIKVNVENDDDWTALHFAVLEGHLEIVLELLKHPDINPTIDTDDDNFTPLHIACKKKNVEVVKALLKHQGVVYGINNPDGTGKPPIYYAFIKNNDDIIMEMLRYVNALSISVIPLKNGDSPLIYAIGKKNIQMLKIILQYSEAMPFILNKVNDSGYTPLMLACKTNQYEIVKELLKHPKIDVNEENDKDQTPLHIASYENSIESCKLLLEKGADVNVKNDDGQTPLDLAKTIEMKNLLQQDYMDKKYNEYIVNTNTR